MGAGEGGGSWIPQRYMAPLSLIKKKKTALTEYRVYTHPSSLSLVKISVAWTG